MVQPPRRCSRKSQRLQPNRLRRRLDCAVRHINDAFAGYWNESRIPGMLDAGGRREAVLQAWALS
jgi:hypothetical protein